VGEYESLKKLETMRKVIPNVELLTHDTISEHNEKIFNGKKKTFCKYSTFKIDKGIITCLDYCWPR